MNKHPLIFIGGVQGVGKTTLLSHLENLFDGRFKLLNPGELFRHYFYNERIKTIEEIEELIASELQEMPKNLAAIAHWHYAVRRPSGYIPQISFSRLRRVAESGRFNRIILLLIEAPIDAIRSWRFADYRVKKRELLCTIINEEVEKEEEFWMRYQAIFSQVLGDKKVTSFRLVNIDRNLAQAQLMNLLCQYQVIARPKVLR